MYIVYAVGYGTSAEIGLLGNVSWKPCMPIRISKVVFIEITLPMNI